MKSNVSLLSRIWAMIYDVLLVFSLIFTIGLLASPLIEKIGGLFFYTITLPAIYFYFALSWIKGRQTIGMKALKFQLIQSNGDNITHAQAFIRFTLAILSFAVVGLGFVYQLFNKDNLAWHDKHSDTYLIKN
ncbi:MAG: RDD family protein [Candidatus Thioglobus sp.]|nr:RDD family protein [Candidatus Thioglobus sp.]